MGTQVGDAEGMETPSQRRRFSRSTNGSGNGDGKTLSQTVATEVRGLLDASEAAARAIKDRAAAEAEDLRQALIAEAEATRRDAATQAQQEIASVVGESLRRLSTKASEIDTMLEELRAEAGRFAAQLAELGARMAPTEASSNGHAVKPEEERRGRLIALTMAINGASRDETARYLEENLSLPDVGALLDTVYR